ncbi:hypothetical protein ACFXKD_23215 [Nocardiopsis aegyptia]|uniref:hypothetical protein n=1 Tax=Nocardiopsis aegyptia TaxID=220378 RepID=UPI003670995A
MNQGGRAGGGRRPVRRPVGKRHPARRMAGGFGYAALVGLGLLLLCIPLGVVLNLTGVGLDGPAFLVPIFLGFALMGGGWVVWGSWSSTLDRYSEPLSTTAKLTLAATLVLVLGVLCFLAAGSPLLLYTDTDPPDSLIPVVIALAGLGVLLIAGTILGSAVYGGIALGGPRWWWVGALLSVCLVTAAVGIAIEQMLLTVPSVAGLVLACFGYRWARVSGLEQGRPDAIEAEGERRRTGGR